MYAPHTAGLQRHKSPPALSPPHVNMFNSYSYLTGTNAPSQQASGDSLDVVGVSDATAARLLVNEQNTRTVIQRGGLRQAAAHFQPQRCLCLKEKGKDL